MDNPKHMHALGMITSGFQTIEFYLALFAWGLMGKDRRIGQTVTSQISFSKLVLLVSNLFRARTYDEPLNEELKTILSRALELEKDRNRVVHSTYLQTSDDIESELLRIKIVSRLHKGLVQQWETMTVEELMDIAVEIAQAVKMLAGFISRVREPLGIEFSTDAHFPSPSDNEDIPY